MSIAAPVSPRLLPIVIALGVSQIIGYGTVFYGYPIFAPTMARDLGVEEALVFGLLSAGLLISGLAGPWLGRTMDRLGAARVMAVGSVLSALLLVCMAAAPEIWSFALAVLALLTISPTVFYSAAFVAAAAASPTQARRLITNITLIAGFSSSLFWPLSGFLLEAIGWRWALVLYAFANILIGLPLHLLVARLTGPVAIRTPKVGETHATPLESRARRRTFWLVSLSYGLSALPASAMAVHIVPVFQSLGLGSTAYLISMLFGPAQVIARLVDSIFWRGFHPLVTALIAFGSIAICMGILVLPLPPIVAALAFSVFFGIGQGLTSIVIGTLPLALFGHDGYGEIVGRIGLVRLMFSSGAPLLLSIMLASIGIVPAFAILFVVALFGVIPLLILLREHGWRG
ncbi:Predicted arabinose efflux permease, MFS family [Devosia enhydra]|uniref:Predicted arabinose efflux permease, MFS family n=1 Tax=Devosia enhydra TaxID=665118 RepID=A0A1K2HTV2_9HYPH|nr:MFS transporter [Devosia enhydra]SFZ81507.1 Predicted arabinose efflux permease, MFS family [Devosia enhydra]